MYLLPSPYLGVYCYHCLAHILQWSTGAIAPWQSVGNFVFRKINEKTLIKLYKKNPWIIHIHHVWNGLDQRMVHRFKKYCRSRLLPWIIHHPHTSDFSISISSRSVCQLSHLDNQLSSRVSWSSLLTSQSSQLVIKSSNRPVKSVSHLFWPVSHLDRSVSHLFWPISHLVGQSVISTGQ